MCLGLTNGHTAPLTAASWLARIMVTTAKSKSGRGIVPPAAIDTGVERSSHEGLQPRLGQSTCPLPQMYKSRQLDLGERGR